MVVFIGAGWSADSPVVIDTHCIVGSVLQDNPTGKIC